MHSLQQDWLSNVPVAAGDHVVLTIAAILLGLDIRTVGGMAGCAMIGQSVINVKSGGRGRPSTLSAGLFLLIMVVFLGDWVAQIPMAALVAVMIMVSIGTFNWASVWNLRSNPKSFSTEMIVTVVVVVATHDLAQGVLAGVLVTGFFFAHKVGQVLYVGSKSEDEGRVRSYSVIGQVFFASAERFVSAFDGKAVTRKGVEMIASSPLFRDLPVHLLMSGKQRKDAEKQLDWAKTTLEAAGIEAPTALIPGDAERVIARYAKDQDIDLLIMGAYAHSPLRSLLFGSKTSDLLRSAKIPALLLR